MKWPTFATANHISEYGVKTAARYSIDWSTNAEEKYKQPINGVRVYESGRIEIRRDARRQPHWSLLLDALLGVRFLNPKTDLPGRALFSPDGVRIHKTRLGDITHALYVPKFERLYHVNWLKPITFLSPDAQPLLRGAFTVRHRNVTREQEYLSKLQPAINMGATLIALGITDGFRCTAIDSTVLHLRVPTDFQSEEGRMMCVTLARNPKHLNSQITWACQDSVSVKYLDVS